MRSTQTGQGMHCRLQQTVINKEQRNQYPADIYGRYVNGN